MSADFLLNATVWMVQELVDYPAKHKCLDRVSAVFGACRMAAVPCVCSVGH